MSTVINAVYTHGVLQLLDPTNLREGQRVSFCIVGDDSTSRRQMNPLGLGTHLLHDLPTIPADEIERMKGDIESEFKRVDPNDWK